MLDIGGINSQIIHKDNTEIIEDRRMFLKNLAQELMKPHLVYRASVMSLPFKMRQRIRELAGIPEPQPVTAEVQAGFCGFCPRRKNRKSKKNCSTCNITICTEHTTFVCPACSSIPQLNASGTSTD